jgi:hypothetical protein
MFRAPISRTSATSIRCTSAMRVRMILQAFPTDLPASFDDAMIKRENQKMCRFEKPQGSDRDEGITKACRTGRLSRIRNGSFRTANGIGPRRKPNLRVSRGDQRAKSGLRNSKAADALVDPKRTSKLFGHGPASHRPGFPKEGSSERHASHKFSQPSFRTYVDVAARLHLSEIVSFRAIIRQFAC